MNDNDSDSAEPSSARFLQNLRPLRDLQSNWTVDLARNLEEYLLRICSGNVSADEEAIFSVNFAEAALLLQGSVQVYSRKVEYLYSLVVHALEFLSQKSHDEAAAAGESGQQKAPSLHNGADESDDPFWGIDNITVEAKTLLDSVSNSNAPPGHYVRPPANLVVLEGECFDAVGDTGELETFLLATNDLYRDFILLDPCDAVAVDDFLGFKASNVPGSLYRGSSASKGCKSFRSPNQQSEGTGRKSSAKKNQDSGVPKSPCADHSVEPNHGNEGSSHRDYDFPCDDLGFGAGELGAGDLGNTDDEDEDDDPWKPLNPHEPGTLKVKPYRKVKSNRRAGSGSKKLHPLAVEFPLAKLWGPISSELIKIWEEKFGAYERDGTSQPLYEKLLQSLCPRWLRDTDDGVLNSEGNDEDGGGDLDNELPDFRMPDNTFNDEDEPMFQEKPLHEEPDAHTSLEDLCQSHLDALLASLAENEKQTELATWVSTWKQRIEKNLEEQDSRPPFDIHRYGDSVLDKLSKKGEKDETMSFGDVVTGQEKHDIARTFSALLQLVNNGDVDLMRSSSDNICHSGTNPFYVRLLKNERKKGIILLCSSKKRAISPIGTSKHPSKHKHNNTDANSSSPGSNTSYRFSTGIGEPSRSRCTPEGKKRRKSQIVSPPSHVSLLDNW